MRTIIILKLLFIPIILSAQPGINWQKSYGGTQQDQCNFLIGLPGGDIVIGGSTTSNNIFFNTNRGNYDGYMMRLKTNGDTVWIKSYGGSDVDLLSKAVYDNVGNIYAIGNTISSNSFDVGPSRGQSDVWLIKVDTGSGNLIWSKNYGSSNYDAGVDVVMESNSRIVIAAWVGGVGGDVIAYKGGNDYWVAKVDSSGVIINSKNFGGSNADYASCIIKTSDNNYLVGGSVYSFNGDITGFNGFVDGWIAKIDTGLQLIWQKCYGGSKRDDIYTLLELPTGDLLIGCGSASDDGDLAGIANFDTTNTQIWLLKTSSTGSLLKSKLLGGTDWDQVNNVVKRTQKELIMSAEVSSTDGDIQNNKGYADKWIVSLDTGLNVNWARTYGGGSSEYGGQIVVNDSGNLYMGASTYSNSGDVTVNYGSYDAWVVELCMPADTAVKRVGNTFTSDNSYTTTTFQWYDCDAKAIIPGATSSTFTANQNGNFAVILNTGCRQDTSACYNVSGINVNEVANTNGIELYPNPNNGIFSLSLPQGAENITATLADLLGKQIAITIQRDNNKLIISTKQVNTGMYLLTIVVDGRITHRRVVVR